MTFYCFLSQLLCIHVVQMLLIRRLPSTASSLVTTAFPWRSRPPIFHTEAELVFVKSVSFYPKPCSLSLYSTSTSHSETSSEFSDLIDEQSSKRGPLEPGLYLVATPIGNLEDITLRALRVLKSANVILSEDTRHSGKLLQHYNIRTPLLSYHKFNESQREQTVLKRLKQGEIVALISDAGTPGISDPGTELAKLCVDQSIPVFPIPGPSAFVAALSASGLATNEFTFVGFLPKHTGSRRERLMVSASEPKTQIFYVPPHKLCQFLEETSSIFGYLRRCVIAREITKIHEQFWRGTLGEAKDAFSTQQPKGEITLLVEGKAICAVEAPSEDQLENELRELISSGHNLSMAVKLVAEGTSVRRKTVYSLALKKFGKQLEAEDDLNKC
ncbi:ribosomal RNA small subunit methyltransferase I [Mangifera indica]|uniref:ribosomal RNA small subunit methyltransferase I n=1 Tax=Mangifera indica TaxID=29780 RepID=UPI001CF94DFD|nr:ribosomal RNA small subunit methyltransferase I [Mangifera indica]